GVEYNYQRAGHAMDATPAPAPVAQLAAGCGTDAPTYSRDRPGMSAFVLEDGVVYHTYSAYARGVDGLWGMTNAPSAGNAGTSLEFNIKSNYRYKVGIKFYSQTRNHVWPDSDNFWVLDDYGTHTYRLSCIRGEEICYGAWATGNDKTYWGVGHGGN